ncbi:MAG TPA: ATP-binding protein, partial [Candidatus Sulfotelmatobacter sp.]|nr:ATP-binding protein [Candidatus Sulfotelmatobacter sp.]
MGTESNIKSITPGPRILIAIARTAITPINALCELIDNSIDGFINAERLGHKIENPTITITIPSKQDIDSGVGALIIEDNGPGMDADTAINAVTAGYSGQDNPRDNLGLFGMGFNISSGKLGRTTILKSARKEDKTGSKITINLPDLVKTGSFEVPEDKFEKPNPNYSGTIIQIQDWWPQGDPNYNFIIKLATTNKNSIREQIGRIYSTKIRDGLSIIIADKPVEPFEHCRWLENRFVLNNGEKIPAYFKVDEVIGRELRCTNCFELVTNNSEKCPTCDNTSFKEFKNRIYGWLGIQRIAHSTNYGIDLIRNGRLIRQWEKEAFFEWKNPDNPEESIKDYPIDPGYYLGGRIIGEVHLDFVPVDFLKTNFQQTSLAWLDAISFLRGTTSLQPARAAG